MRSAMIWGLVLVGCIVGEGFAVSSRNDINFIEEELNENHTEYITHKDEFTLAEGTITAIHDPTEREGLDKLTGTDDWLCTIEFEAAGQKVTDQFFPCDTDNDKVGGKVEIAYKLRSSGGRGERPYSVAARTEYVKSVKQLRKNTIIGAGFGIGIAAALGGLIISVKRK